MISTTNLIDRVLTPQEIGSREESDKLAAAIHEAGHAAVALALGGRFVRAMIQPTHTKEPFGERLWIGKVSWSHAENHTLAVSEAVGIAGAVAEAINCDEWGDWFGDFIEINELSDSDAEHLTEDNVHDASIRAHDILQDHWDFVVRLADALIQDEGLTGMALI
jgi:hypothetical protein